MERSREEEKIKLPSLVEEYTSEDREFLETCIRGCFIERSLALAEVFIVGSSCFGIDDTGDVDILCISPGVKGDVLDINGYNPSSSFYRLNMDIRKRVQAHYVNRLDLLVAGEGIMKNQRSDLGFMIPYFSVTKGVLYHKTPGDKIPFNFK